MRKILTYGRMARFLLCSSLVFLALAVQSAGAGDRPQYLSLTYAQIFSDTLQVDKIYLDRLYAVPDSIFRTEFEAEFLLILNARQREEYLALPTSIERRDFIAQYWRAYNPDPLLPVNDRLVDHVRRCAYARKHFPSNLPPYIDDRGKYYIKYGKPTIRYVDPGGIRRIALFSPGLYEQIEKFYTLGTAPPQLYSVPANESWGYENVAPNFVVHFVWKGQEFKEISSLAEIVRSGKRSNIAWQWSDLLKRRASVSPILAEAANQVESFEMELLHVAFSGNSGFSGDKISTGSAHDKMIRRLKSGEEELLKFRKRVPVASYDPIFAHNELRFTERISQFRGRNGRTRIAVQILAPLRKNLIGPQRESKDSLQLEFAAMLRNRVFAPLASDEQHRILPVAMADSIGFPHAVGQVMLQARPQKTELTLHLIDRKHKQLGFKKKVLEVRRFDSDGLQMSDIQLFYPVTNDIQKAFFPTMEINQIELIPYPFLKINKNKPLYCYFEIYNLQTSGIKQSYEIAYRVSSEKGGQTLFQKLSRIIRGSADVSISLKHAQPIYQDTATELIALDLSNLRNGKYNLEITVSDASNAELSIHRSRQIVIDRF